MSRYKLTLDDTDCYQQSIIGITSELEDFKLAYLLNKHLFLNFERTSNLKNYKPVKCDFSLYKHTAKENEIDWSLISNTSKIETIINQGGLFEDIETRVTNTYYLLKGKKQFEYFIKTEEKLTKQQTLNILTTLRNIPNVVYSENIEFESLKNKENLIF